MPKLLLLSHVQLVCLVRWYSSPHATCMHLSFLDDMFLHTHNELMGWVSCITLQWCDVICSWIFDITQTNPRKQPRVSGLGEDWDGVHKDWCHTWLRILITIHGFYIILFLLDHVQFTFLWFVLWYLCHVWFCPICELLSLLFHILLKSWSSTSWWVFNGS